MHRSKLPNQRLIFMGSAQFSAASLKVLIDSEYTVVAVYSKPPKEKDRGHHFQKTPVHLLAQEHNIPVFTPENFKDRTDIDYFYSLEADLAVVVAYGLILPKRILIAPRLGCINIHASLLPRWRGAAPIQRSILANDALTGITLMRMDEGLDTGDMLAKTIVPINFDDTTQTLTEKLSHAGAHLLEKHLGDLIDDYLTPVSQPHDGICYAHKLEKKEGVLNWHADSASTIDAKVRALNPWPKTWFEFEGSTINVHRAKCLDDVFSWPPGTFFKTNTESLCVVCADQRAVSLLSLQLPGGKILDVTAFLNGFQALRRTILLIDDFSKNCP